jgi:hypothetical protein
MKAFLSSTYVDLVGHRQAAAEAIERLQANPQMNDELPASLEKS